MTPATAPGTASGAPSTRSWRPSALEPPPAHRGRRTRGAVAVSGRPIGLASLRNAPEGGLRTASRNAARCGFTSSSDIHAPRRAAPRYGLSRWKCERDANSGAVIEGLQRYGFGLVLHGHQHTP